MKQLFKNCYLLGFITIVSSTSFSQVQAHNNLETFAHRSKIVEVYGEEFLMNNPDLLAVLNQLLDERVHLVEEPLTSEDKFPKLSSYPLMNKNNPAITGINFEQFVPASFNPLHYNLPFFMDKTFVVRIDGTNYVLVIDPVKKP